MSPVSDLPAALAQHVAAMHAAAKAVRERAHVPYSRFQVGAAVLDENGHIHAGCNVENAAYPLGQCAESSALSAMVAAGGRRVMLALVMGEAPEVVTPCGGCRQRLREFASADVPVLMADTREVKALMTMAQLLPSSFGPAHLNQGEP